MKILVLTNLGMGLYKFRKELLSELILKGNEVFVSVPYDEYTLKIKELGCVIFETKLERRSINPFKDLKLFAAYIKLIRKIHPDVVLTYTVKPNIYGGTACRLTKTPYIANVTGLGTAIENKGILSLITLFLYKIGFKKASCVFFQNEPNRNLFISKKIVSGNTKLIPGSGVNLNEYCFEEYPTDDETVRFIYIGRIMKAKGIDELLEAAKRIKEMNLRASFELIGFCEDEYTEQLNHLESKGIIKFHGMVDDVRPYIKNAHATILPSYHEGTANVLLETLAAGRPVLASRVTGCVEAFDDNVSGIGFEVKDVDSLIEAIISFIKTPLELKREMGIAGRYKMENEYNRQIVINSYISEIEKEKFS